MITKIEQGPPERPLRNRRRRSRLDLLAKVRLHPLPLYGRLDPQLAALDSAVLRVSNASTLQAHNSSFLPPSKVHFRGFIVFNSSLLHRSLLLHSLLLPSLLTSATDLPHLAATANSSTLISHGSHPTTRFPPTVPRAKPTASSSRRHAAPVWSLRLAHCLRIGCGKPGLRRLSMRNSRFRLGRGHRTND